MLFNVIIVVLLLISYFAPFISPKTSVFFAYLGLIYPILVGLNLLFVVYWLLWKERLFLLSSVAIMLGLLSFSRFFQMTFFQPESEHNNSVTVMSFNVRLFDLYNWSGNEKSKESIEKFVFEQDKDIVCFQEYYRGVKTHFSVQESMEEIGGYGYHYEHITTSAPEKKGDGNNLFGSAIFSKYPFIDSGFVEFEEDGTNHISWVDIVKKGDTLRIVNAHVGSIRLQNADYQLIGGNENKKWAHEKQNKQDIFTRMTKAYYKRVDQVDVLNSFLSKSPYETVLCIDLNDVPNSYAYNEVAVTYRDAFTISGWGIGSTYIGENVFNRIMPVNRIDYIFHSKSVDSRNFVTHSEKLSDHRAISCEIWF